MALKITKVDVWAVEIVDEAGGLAKVLGALSEAGASVDCVIARRQADKFRAGVVYVSPIKGKKAQGAARAAGLEHADDLATLRVEGPDKPGMGATMARAVAEAGINLRGLSGLVGGRNFVAYLGFDSAEDAAKATKALKKVR